MPLWVNCERFTVRRSPRRCPMISARSIARRMHAVPGGSSNCMAHASHHWCLAPGGNRRQMVACRLVKAYATSDLEQIALSMPARGAQHRLHLQPALLLSFAGNAKQIRLLIPPGDQAVAHETGHRLQDCWRHPDRWPRTRGDCPVVAWRSAAQSARLAVGGDRLRVVPARDALSRTGIRTATTLHTLCRYQRLAPTTGESSTREVT